MPPLLTGQKCGLEETPEPFIFEDSRVPEGKEGDVPKGGGAGIRAAAGRRAVASRDPRPRD